MRRTCYRPREGVIEKAFSRLVLAEDDCGVEERTTKLLLVSGRDVEQTLVAAGYSTSRVHANVFVATKT